MDSFLFSDRVVTSLQSLTLLILTCGPFAAVGHDRDLDGPLLDGAPADAPHVRLHLALPLPRVLGPHVLHLDDALVALVVALEPETFGDSEMICHW